MTDEQKHTLPVNARCKWQHSHGIALRGVGCLSADGNPADSFNDIWLCMEEAECEITGVPYCGFLRCGCAMNPASGMVMSTVAQVYTDGVRVSSFSLPSLG